MHGDVGDADAGDARLQVEWNILPHHSEILVVDGKRWRRYVIGGEAHGAADQQTKAGNVAHSGFSPSDCLKAYLLKNVCGSAACSTVPGHRTGLNLGRRFGLLDWKHA